ncbi:MAG: hypothetical protein ACOX4V_09405 [Anaerovoracaceae bacterium]
MMPENASSVNVEKLFSTVCELPYCKIDREEFLTKELKNRVSPLQLADALENGTINAKIPINILDDIARGAIALETSKVTLISTANIHRCRNSGRICHDWNRSDRLSAVLCPCFPHCSKARLYIRF